MVWAKQSVPLVPFNGENTPYEMGKKIQKIFLLISHQFKIGSLAIFGPFK